MEFHVRILLASGSVQDSINANLYPRPPPLQLKIFGQNTKNNTPATWRHLEVNINRGVGEWDTGEVTESGLCFPVFSLFSYGPELHSLTWEVKTPRVTPPVFPEGLEKGAPGSWTVWGTLVLFLLFLSRLALRAGLSPREAYRSQCRRLKLGEALCFRPEHPGEEAVSVREGGSGWEKLAGEEGPRLCVWTTEVQGSPLSRTCLRHSKGFETQTKI